MRGIGIMKAKHSFLRPVSLSEYCVSRTQIHCPAMCKNTGKCYGKTYFEQKSIKAKDVYLCDKNACKWKENFER